MTVSEHIREDWGTIKHFAKNNGISYQSLVNALSGRTGYKTVTSKLIELGYIRTADDLKKT